VADAAVRVENLGKRYRLSTSRAAYGTLGETLADTLQRALRRSHAREPRKTIWALSDVDFEVSWGEVLGIVGRNGAGKSTLLKILSRVTYPTTGRARLYGRVGSLLEVGTGFHTELTGRENIYLSGAILGMRKAEIQQKFDEIVDFAEIDRFLDTPVKRYSTGMFMRLAFAVAAHLEPEILIVDEVLAVGDAAFQKKCLGKMDLAAEEGRTILFVSHNMATIQALCDRAIWLKDGRIIEDGSTATVVRRYLESQATPSVASLENYEERSGDGTARVVSLEIRSVDPDGLIRPTSRLRFQVGYRSDKPVRFPQFVISIFDELGIGLFLLHSEFTDRLPEALPPEGIVSCETDPINLTPGRCAVEVELLKGNVRADLVSHAGTFDVEHDDVYGTGMLPPRDWVRYVVGQRWWLNGGDPASGRR
jgi:lipopolysaccharide transport system ATP-binding protein